MTQSKARRPLEAIVSEKSARAWRNDALLDRLYLAKKHAGQKLREARELRDVAQKDLERVKAESRTIGQLGNEQQNAHDEMMIAREMAAGLRREKQFDEAHRYKQAEGRYRAKRDQLAVERKRLIDEDRDAERVYAAHRATYQAAKSRFNQTQAAFKDELSRPRNPNPALRT
jgi:hypothetical protein